jgi:hypothetical protein
MLAQQLPTPPPSVHDSKTLAAWGSARADAARRLPLKWVAVAAVIILPIAGVVGIRACSDRQTTKVAASAAPAMISAQASSTIEATPPTTTPSQEPPSQTAATDKEPGRTTTSKVSTSPSAEKRTSVTKRKTNAIDPLSDRR